MSSSRSEKLSEYLMNVDEDILEKAYSIDSAEKLRMYSARQKRSRFTKIAVIAAVIALLIVAVLTVPALLEQEFDPMFGDNNEESLPPPWVYDENIHIVAQPMTHAEVLRRFFLENGFRILKESSATDGKRYYCVISAQYDGVKRDAGEWYTYVGELIKNSDDISRSYINKTVAALEKKFDAMKNAGVDGIEALENTVTAIKQKITEENNG